MKKLISVLGVSAFCLPATAQAHFNLVTPPPSSAETSGGKGAPPCGPNPTPGVATPAQGGHPLVVSIAETTQHTGFYRFALALNSPSELPPDNTVYSGPNLTGMILTVTGPGNSGSAAFEATPVFPVLADGMYQHTANSPVGGTLMLPRASDPPSIMLPNVTCASCTLQVIEFMQDHGANTGGGYFYHHCANLKITADPNLPAFVPPTTGMGGASSGGSSNGGTGGSSTSGGTGTGGASGGTPGTVGTGGGTAGVASSSGGSGGVAPSGTGGQTNSSAGVAGTGVFNAGGSAAAPASADNNGCSCSVAKRSPASLPWASLLVGLLAFGRRRRAKR